MVDNVFKWRPKEEEEEGRKQETKRNEMALIPRLLLLFCDFASNGLQSSRFSKIFALIHFAMVAHARKLFQLY